jgi:putative peptidoglycan lipid II flippase
MFYAPGLLGYSAVKIASPSFYAMGDSRTPVVVSVSSVAVNLVLNIGLVRVMGYRGLALGTAIAAVFNAGVLLVVLRQRLEGLDGRRVGIALVKILAASALMGVAAHYASGFSYGLLPGHAWYVRMVRVFGTIAAAVLVLAASARLLRIQELSVAMDRVLGRFVRR